VNDVVRLKALIDRKKVIITEDTVREALHLDDADSIDCLPNEEIFTELARMGLRRMKKVGTGQRVESSKDTVLDDVSKQGEIIANMDADEDVTLKDIAAVAKEVEVEKDAKVEKDAEVQGRPAE
nr:hypothetical protein [Tanacetum cinerariifolium]